MSKLKKNTEYHALIERIGESYQLAKSNIVTAINTEMLKAYWEIGKHIIDFEQGGKLKAEYGKALLVNLSKDLSLRYGRGFSRSNLNYMRLLYSKYQICETLSHILSWSHYYELLKVEEPIGLILSEEKDDIMVEYAMLNDNSNLIVSKYQLYLPDIEQLKNRVREIIEK